MKINPHKKEAYIRKVSRVVCNTEKSDTGFKNLQLYLEKGIKNNPIDEPVYPLENPKEKNKNKSNNLINNNL